MTVYFIKPIGMDGPVKIGHSRSPERRKEALEYWSPFPLEIVAECEGMGGMERRFHAMFAADHVHHEWFKVTPALQMVVDQIAGGSFDFDSLPDAKHLPRKPKDLSYMTPEWRAKQSVQVAAGHAFARKRREALCEANSLANRTRPAEQTSAAA